MQEPMVPRPEQESAILETLEHKSHISRAEGGSGKTLVGVEAAIQSGASTVLVVAPLNTFTGWRKTFERQSCGTITPLVIDSTKQGKTNFEVLVSRTPGVYLIGWERFRLYDWSKMPLDFVILDEVHRQQNRKSTTHTAVLTTRHAEYKLALSATPAGNRIEGMWATITWLWWGNKELVPAFWPWVTKYLRTERDQYVGKKIMGERNPGSIWTDLPSKSYFPAPFQKQPIIHEIECELLPYQRKIYDRFEEAALVWLGEHPLVADLPAVQSVRLRQICLASPSIRWVTAHHKDPDTGETWDEEVEEVYFEDDAKSTKADAVLDVLKDLYVEKPEPVLIFTHSRKFATMLTHRLQDKGYNARSFIGGMTQSERERLRAGFGTEFDIMVATISSIGTGTDGLQEVCHIEFWMSLDDNRILNEQARWRLSRDGQKKTVQRYLFLAANTLESRQLARLTSDAAQLSESFETEKEAA